MRDIRSTAESKNLAQLTAEKVLRVLILQEAAGIWLNGVAKRIQRDSDFGSQELFVEIFILFCMYCTCVRVYVCVKITE
jgi:hypothetical protein